MDDLRRDEEVVMLPDAVPGIKASIGPSSVQYGWVRGVLPSPSPYDLYLVRLFIPPNSPHFDQYAFRVIAYVDRYARVFETSDVVYAPPAHYPSMAFARYHGKGEGSGCVQTYDESGKAKILANYLCRDDAYSLFGSWYDFSAYRAGLSLDEAIARAYFALVWRPRFLHKDVPPRGLSRVNELLRGRDAVRVMQRTAQFLATAEEDDALRVPAPARFLHKWLDDAGLAEAYKQVHVAGGNSGVLLRQQSDYSNQYCLVRDDDSPLSERAVWKLESALNRYEMLCDGLGDRASRASMENCTTADHDLRERFPLQVGEDLTPVDWGVAPTDAQLASKDVESASQQPAGEWDVRLGIARAMEEALVPVRFSAAYRANVEEGVVAFEILVPDADMAPQMLWVGQENSGHWSEQTPENQAWSAREYAQRIGIMLAAIAARQSARIHRVTLTAEWFYEADASADHAYGVIVDCDYLRQPGNFRLAVENPQSYFARLPRLSAAFAQVDIAPDDFDDPNPF